MELPNRDEAYIQTTKLTGYLLSETHVVGKSKAKFFRAKGFNETNLPLLEQALLNLARTQPVQSSAQTIHGTKYVIIGAINTALASTISVLSVRIIDSGQTASRFVTARPYKSSLESPNHD
ncbi:MAG: DUF6883 domain-containing protein [Cyanobacteria bacterium J06648_16]